MKAPSLREVARRAGVSAMTASRALRNHGAVSAASRQVVLQAAQELGYRPNPLISALMTQRRASRVVRDPLAIAFVTSFPTRSGWRASRINRDFHDGAAAACARQGYKLEDFWLREPGMSGRRLSSILYHRGVNGVMIAPLPVALGHLRLEWDLFSAVALGYSLAFPRLHRAVNHQFRSIRVALRRLRKRGCRRIGLALKASIDERVEHHYLGGYLVDQHRAAPGDRIPPHVPPDRDWCAEGFLRWFKEHRPEVVITHHEAVAEWLARAGVGVPGDVALVQLNLPDKSGAVAGIYQNGLEVGAAAADFLVSMLLRNDRGLPALPHSVLVEGTWVEGLTLPGPRERASKSERPPDGRRSAEPQVSETS